MEFKSVLLNQLYAEFSQEISTFNEECTKHQELVDSLPGAEVLESED